MLKRIVCTIITLAMFVSILSLNVSAADRSLERMVGACPFEIVFNGEIITGNTYANADSSYAYAAVVSNSQGPYYVYAYICNAVDDLDDERGAMDGEIGSISVDITLGELQEANEYPMIFSQGCAYIGTRLWVLEEYNINA